MSFAFPETTQDKHTGEPRRVFGVTDDCSHWKSLDICDGRCSVWVLVN